MINISINAPTIIANNETADIDIILNALKSNEYIIQAFLNNNLIYEEFITLEQNETRNIPLKIKFDKLGEYNLCCTAYEKVCTIIAPQTIPNPNNLVCTVAVPQHIPTPNNLIYEDSFETLSTIRFCWYENIVDPQTGEIKSVLRCSCETSCAWITDPEILY